MIASSCFVFGIRHLFFLIRSFSYLLCLIHSSAVFSLLFIFCCILSGILTFVYSYLFSTFTDTKQKFNKIAFGDGIFACMSRDFDIFMPKHLAGQWVLNSYINSYYCIRKHFRFKEEKAKLR